ncbi:MAG TPA: hypothetical protein VHM68_02670 [Candidatus Deferrimicrobium sp.]|nr:hypothetical protein [Candidatus Deferrimicrobium sp.]
MKPPSPGTRPANRIFLALAAALLLPLATGSSPAADFPAGSAPAATDNAANSVARAVDNGWVDRTHSRVERDLFDTVVWFDRFFGDDQIVITERPESYLRWKNELRWDQEEHYSFRSTVRASLSLPRLKNRWHLVISGESRGDPNAIIPEDPGNPALDIGSHGRTGSTELVYDIFRTPNSILDVGAGVQVKIPPDAFVRTRFQHARPITLNTLGRFTATAYWDARDGLGESNQVDLERWLAPPTLLRWSNSVTITEASRWWTWGTELSHLHKLSPKSAFTSAVGASGSTHPSWVATNYRILARYRRNVWRKWLFLEGEPDIHWPMKEDGSRKPVWGATLRVEILFTGAEPDPPADGGSRF